MLIKNESSKIINDLRFIYTHLVQQCKVGVGYAIPHDFHSTYEQIETLGHTCLRS